MALPQFIALLDFKYFRSITNVNDKVDDNFIKPAMKAAMDVWVQPYLGDALMAKIKADTLSDTIAGNYLILRDEYMSDAIVWATMVELIPSMSVKIDNGQIHQRLSEDAQPASDQAVKGLRDDARNKMQHYLQRLEEYLCANSSLFTEYSSNVHPQRGPRADGKGAYNYQISSGNTASSYHGYPRRTINQLP